ncbi:ATP11-domain-containing protein [Delitschia confertaspora ATCC 74209]|uniref:ATP11-domain-containing protein n=1 Tax=Delitschia confertaspora ATCC 74209 TaxID=1513339 RepID=A0A9P4JJA3_9PLEO|nr:ATP11-domain-containing protein [Delitschia confertaspora ATCC 74209]
MASTLRVPTIRHILRQSHNPRICQRRWAQVQDVRFLVTHGAQDRVMAKYREKLESKAKQEGLKDISELQQAYKDKIEKLRKEAAVPGATAPLTPPASPTSTSASPFPLPPPPPTPAASPSSSPSTTQPPPPGVKTLASFLDLSHITPLPADQIQALWRLRHSPDHAAHPSDIHFDLPASTFRTLVSNAKKHPTFVVPLPRQIQAEEAENASAAQKQGAELHYLQFAHPHPHTMTLIFTTLLEFQTRGEFATPHTTITFHSELADTHDLVLGQGVVVKGRGVSVDDAKWLVMCMQKFYVVDSGKGEGEERRRMLEMFTKGDQGFRVEKLLEEAEKIL